MLAAEFGHLPLDVHPIAGLDAEARIAHIRAEPRVRHAAADRVLGYLQEALVQPPKDRVENILLIGESGMGKTMLIRKFEQQNAARFDDVAGRSCDAHAAPSDGDPVFRSAAGRGECAGRRPFHSQLSSQEPAIRLLRQLGTRVVVIDELNSVLAGTPRQQRVSCSCCAFCRTSCGSPSSPWACRMPGMPCCPMTSFAAGSRWNFRHGRWARICGIS